MPGLEYEKHRALGGRGAKPTIATVAASKILGHKGKNLGYKRQNSPGKVYLAVGWMALLIFIKIP